MFLWLPKHILTAAECGVTNKQRVRSQAKRTDGMSGIEWCFACNIFVLTGYDSRSKALNDNRTLSRTKTFTPHEKAFRHGYRYNIGKRDQAHLIVSGWPQTNLPYPTHLLTLNFPEYDKIVRLVKVTLIFFSAILELFYPVDFFQKIKPICLPQSSTDGTPSGLVKDNYNFDEAVIAGWGWTGREWDPLGRLRAVTTKIWPEYFCKYVVEQAPDIFERFEEVNGVKHYGIT